MFDRPRSNTIFSPRTFPFPAPSCFRRCLHSYLHSHPHFTCTVFVCFLRPPFVVVSVVCGSLCCSRLPAVCDGFRRLWGSAGLALCALHWSLTAHMRYVRCLGQTAHMPSVVRTAFHGFPYVRWSQTAHVLSRGTSYSPWPPLLSVVYIVLRGLCSTWWSLLHSVVCFHGSCPYPHPFAHTPRAHSSAPILFAPTVRVHVNPRSLGHRIPPFFSLSSASTRSDLRKRHSHCVHV